MAVQNPTTTQIEEAVLAVLADGPLADGAVNAQAKARLADSHLWTSIDKVDAVVGAMLERGALVEYDEERIAAPTA